MSPFGNTQQWRKQEHNFKGWTLWTHRLDGGWEDNHVVPGLTNNDPEAKATPFCHQACFYIALKLYMTFTCNLHFKNSVNLQRMSVVCKILNIYHLALCGKISPVLELVVMVFILSVSAGSVGLIFYFRTFPSCTVDIASVTMLHSTPAFSKDSPSWIHHLAARKAFNTCATLE